MIWRVGLQYISGSDKIRPNRIFQDGKHVHLHSKEQTWMVPQDGKGIAFVKYPSWDSGSALPEMPVPDMSDMTTQMILEKR